MTKASNEASKANGAPLYDIFLSYSSRDGSAVAKVQEFFESTRVVENKEIALRLFRDHTDLRGGELTAEIMYAIDRSTYFVLCCSERAVASPWVQMEIAHFLQTRDLSKVIVLVLDGPIPAILPTQLAERELKELDLRDGWFFGWPRPQTRDELLRAIAKVSNANLRSLIDWERRRRIKRRLQLSSLLATSVAMLAVASIVTIRLSPSSDWTRTELDSFSRPVEIVQVVERAGSTPLLRTYSSWTQQSVNRTIFDEGMYEFHVADVDINGRVTGKYSYMKFTRDRDDGVERTYSAGAATGTLQADVAALGGDKNSDKVVFAADLLKLHVNVQTEILEDKPEINSKLGVIVDGANNLYERKRSSFSRDGKESARAKLVSLTRCSDEVFAAFAGHPVFDLGGKVESIVRNFGAVSKDNGKTWDELKLPAEISDEHFKVHAIVASCGQSGPIAILFRPIDGGNSQTQVPRVFLRGSEENTWTDVPCTGFDSTRFEIRGVTQKGGIIALESGKLVVWRDLTHWERFLRGLGMKRGFASS